MKERKPYPQRILIEPSSSWNSRVPDFIPLKFRDQEHIRRIRGMARGMRLREDELSALLVSREMLQQAGTAEEVEEIGRLLAIPAFGACSYLVGQRTQIRKGRLITAPSTQHRALILPTITKPGQRLSTEQLRDRAVAAADLAVEANAGLAGAVSMGASAGYFAKIQMKAGKTMGAWAEAVAVAGLGDIVGDPDNAISRDEAQLMARELCMDAIQAREDISCETGFQTSIIQLASRITPYAVALQAAASDEAYNAFAYAQARYGNQD